jgi:anti-sigma factor RsiW
MRHGISEQQWLEYVDGTLSEREVARLRTHLLICAECAEVPIELNEWRALMLEEARTLRGNVVLSDFEIETLLAKSIERIRQQAPPVIRNSFRWTTAEGYAPSALAYGANLRIGHSPSDHDAGSASVDCR